MVLTLAVTSVVRSQDTKLVFIKVVHTLVWAFMVACIGGIYVFASRGEFVWALGCIGIVFAEVVVLVVNRMRCPLTPLAARFTEDRRPNFDIYLPPWLARYNQLIFGSLFVAGIVYAVLMSLMAA